MSPFRDDETSIAEPVPGLPEPLPEGESLLWQGRPSALTLAIHAFHIRFILAYIVGALGWRVAAQAAAGAPASDLTAIVASGALLGGIGLALVFGLAWLIARSALFTLTEKRLVMRYGVAIRKYVNLPLTRIASADLRKLGRGRGDIVLSLTGKSVGYIYLWPFARPLKFARPQPSLRALPDAERVAGQISTAFAALQTSQAEPAQAADMPAAAVPARDRPQADPSRPRAAMPAGAQPA